MKYNQLHNTNHFHFPLPFLLHPNSQQMSYTEISQHVIRKAVAGWNGSEDFVWDYQPPKQFNDPLKGVLANLTAHTWSNVTTSPGLRPLCDEASTEDELVLFYDDSVQGKVVYKVKPLSSGKVAWFVGKEGVSLITGRGGSHNAPITPASLVQSVSTLEWKTLYDRWNRRLTKSVDVDVFDTCVPEFQLKEDLDRDFKFNKLERVVSLDLIEMKCREDLPPMLVSMRLGSTLNSVSLWFGIDDSSKTVIGGTVQFSAITLPADVFPFLCNGEVSVERYNVLNFDDLDSKRIVVKLFSLDNESAALDTIVKYTIKKNVVWMSDSENGDSLGVLRWEEDPSNDDDWVVVDKIIWPRRLWMQRYVVRVKATPSQDVVGSFVNRVDGFLHRGINPSALPPIAWWLRAHMGKLDTLRPYIEGTFYVRLLWSSNENDWPFCVSFDRQWKDVEARLGTKDETFERDFQRYLRLRFGQPRFVILPVSKTLEFVDQLKYLNHTTPSSVSWSCLLLVSLDELRGGQDILHKIMAAANSLAAKKVELLDVWVQNLRPSQLERNVRRGGSTGLGLSLPFCEPIVTTACLTPSTLREAAKSYFRSAEVDRKDDSPRWDLVDSGYIVRTKSHTRIVQAIDSYRLSPRSSCTKFARTASLVPGSGVSSTLMTVAFEQNENFPGTVFWVKRLPTESECEALAKELVDRSWSHVIVFVADSVCSDESEFENLKKAVEGADCRAFVLYSPKHIELPLRLSEDDWQASVEYEINPMWEIPDLKRLVARMKNAFDSNDTNIALDNAVALAMESADAEKPGHMNVDRHIFVFALAAAKGRFVPIHKWVERAKLALEQGPAELKSYFTLLAFVRQCCGSFGIRIPQNPLCNSTLLGQRDLHELVYPDDQDDFYHFVHPFFACVFLHKVCGSSDDDVVQPFLKPGLFCSEWKKMTEFVINTYGKNQLKEIEFKMFIDRDRDSASFVRFTFISEWFVLAADPRPFSDSLKAIDCPHDEIVKSRVYVFSGIEKFYQAKDERRKDLKDGLYKQRSAFFKTGIEHARRSLKFEKSDRNLVYSNFAYLLAQAARYSFYKYNEYDDALKYLNECSRICKDFIASVNVKSVCIRILLLGLMIASKEDSEYNRSLESLQKDWPGIVIHDKIDESKCRAVRKPIMRAYMRFREPFVVSADELLAEMGEGGRVSGRE